MGSKKFLSLGIDKYFSLWFLILDTLLLCQLLLDGNIFTPIVFSIFIGVFFFYIHDFNSFGVYF